MSRKIAVGKEMEPAMIGILVLITITDFKNTGSKTVYDEIAF